MSEVLLYLRLTRKRVAALQRGRARERESESAKEGEREKVKNALITG
jgi:hypothetical protein